MRGGTKTRSTSKQAANPDVQVTKKRKLLPNHEATDIEPKRQKNSNTDKGTQVQSKGLLDQESEDIFLQILKSKQAMTGGSQTIFKTSCHNLGFRSSNLIHFFQHRETGVRFTHEWKSVNEPVHGMLERLHLKKTLSPFDRRCTAITWHPTGREYLAVASKGGEIILWNINSIQSEVHLPGIGPGGSIQALTFLPSNPRYVLTASIDGTVAQHDLEGKHRHVLADTMNSHDYWYCSLDVNPIRNLLAAGENSGKLTMMNMEGKQLWVKKLHRGKITHAEFNRREDWLLCTASVDRTCQLWDVRMIKDRNSAIATLTHEKPVNSAYFSLCDGVRLLTTDQSQEIRVYRGPFWQLEQTILQPHRHFQHITPQKACWHPYQDTVAVGRYPDKNFPGYTAAEKRTIDMFEAGTGRPVCQLWDPAAKGIISLTKFNHQGDILAATMGVNVLIWKQQEEENDIPDMKSAPKDNKPRKRGQDTERKRKDRKVSKMKLKVLTQTKQQQKK